MALTVRAMASAAQGLRPVEPSHSLCNSKISRRASGVNLRWNANANFLARSFRKTRQRRRSHAGSWQLEIRGVRRLRAAVTENGETVASISGRSKKSGEQLDLKVDGFVSDYSDSDVDDSVDDSERIKSSTDGDGRILGGVRQRSSGAEEIDLRFMFLEAIMERARKTDIDGVEEAMTGMALAGLDAGPRAYHGLVVAYARSGDSEGAVRIIVLCMRLLP